MERHPLDIEELVRRLNESRRLRESSHFSDEVFRGEPIIKTGRQVAEEGRRRDEAARRHEDAGRRYRELHAMSRWLPGEGVGSGRWLTEAEHFYRQARLMEDFEDDRPYEGTISSYYPSYATMSDRQLRGYFTWRARVRRGEDPDGPTSFALVYLYELLCGIGAEDPLDGFRKMEALLAARRDRDPGLVRRAASWLLDYVVYHGLDPSLVEDGPDIAFDRALLELVRRSAPFDPAVVDAVDVLIGPDGLPSAEEIRTGGAPGRADASREGADRTGPDAAGAGASGKGRGKGRNRPPALPLPPDEEAEGALLAAIDGLSSYRARLSRLYRDHPDDLRHVACAVYVRLLAYYRAHRARGLIETLFGELVRLDCILFPDAIFFEPRPHRDAKYLLDPIDGFLCRNGRWQRVFVAGPRSKSSELGRVIREVDRRLRLALDYAHPLKERQVPKYLATMIDREIADWLAWKEAHAPLRIEIDLSRLAGIRTAAAATREALLIDEEREDAPLPAAAPEPERAAKPEPTPPEPPAAPASMAPLGSTPHGSTGDAAPVLDEAERAYLEALARGGRPPVPAETTEDMLVDAINEKLFDLVGDTVVEFVSEGARIIEDYEEDVRKVLSS